jgi:hypothetical protein
LCNVGLNLTKGEMTMTMTTGDQRIKWSLGVVLLAVLLVGNFQPYALNLNDSDLARIHGTGFWSDPCTQDGFAFGAGAVLCGAGNLGGCLGAVGGLIKAWKVDNCF